MNEFIKRRQEDWLARADILTEALPFMRRHAGKTVVVKYGGHAMGDASLAENFAKDVVLLKQVGINPVVVHGGGKRISKALKTAGMESRFVNGLRYTDESSINIVAQTLNQKVNQQICHTIQAVGVRSPPTAQRIELAVNSIQGFSHAVLGLSLIHI